MLFALFLGFLSMSLCLSVASPILNLVGCPDDCFDGARLYLRIYAVGLPALMMYNFGASVIRTTGDSRRPFIYITSAGLLNVCLNLILCFVMSNKVAAVAIATVASQYLSCILTLIHLNRLDGGCAFKINKRPSFSFRELWGILKIGAPCAFNSSLYSLSNLQMGAALNAYGSEAVAGNSSAITMESLISSFTTGFNAAIVPFVGQNVGRGNRERVKKSILLCALLSVSIGFVLSQLIFALRYQILGMYLPNSDNAVAFGIERMKYVLLLYPVAALFNTFVNSMQAFGYSLVPMINSVLTVLVFRFVWVEFIYPPLDAANHHISNLFVCYTYSWTLNLIVQSIMFAFVFVRYLRGRVKEL